MAGHYDVSGPYDHIDWQRVYNLRESISDMSLARFRAKDLGPLLRILNINGGEIPFRGDIEQLEEQLNRGA